MTWVKICGITNLEDALVAVEAGADAIGFVFYEKSPRRVDATEVKQIVTEVAEDSQTVGIFVGGITERTIKIANDAGLSAIQVHDSEDGGMQESKSSVAKAKKREGFSSFTPFIFKVFLSLPALAILDDMPMQQRILSAFEVHQPRALPAQNRPTIFLDSSTPQVPGGTGKVFDWERAAPLVESMQRAVNVVIAGGLKPENVSDAMRILHPWGVDVSSGVEARPGKKDPEKVRAFIKAVREADKANSRN